MARRATIILFVLLALFVAGVLALRFAAWHSAVPKDKAIARTREIVSRAGGAAPICEEAGKLFGGFDGTRLKILRKQDLTDFPSIRALEPLGIWPTGIWPAADTGYIRVRVGNHFRSFDIHIFKAALDPSTATGLHEAQVDGCIYVLY